MTKQISTIVLPTRPQPDTIVAIFLLQKFGQEIYRGVETASLEINPKAQPADDKLLIDVGGGELDHHNTDSCASEIVAKKLNVHENPALRNLLAYARRDDLQGKGTISKDPIDRTFGLSGLIASLNKEHTDNPQKVVDIVLPLLQAHFYNSNEHYVELPKLLSNLKNTKKFQSETLSEPTKNTKVAFVASDHMGLPGYLRSNLGGNYRVVVQKRSTGHVNIMTKQNPKIDLSKTIALIRLHEAELNNIEISDEDTLYKKEIHEQIPNWYYDTATNSLLNGGVTPDSIPPTKIAWEDLKAIVLHGIQNS